MGLRAWVTSAMEDETANKALVLAASLRRVKSAQRLVVITASRVSKDLRKKLKSDFDLVVPLEQETLDGDGDGDLETQAKICALSMGIFEKCVYLSPTMMVVKNCDDIFDKYGTLASSFKFNNEVDSSIFLFSPSIVSQTFENFSDNLIAKNGISNKLDYYLGKCVPLSGKLDGEYNVKPWDNYDWISVKNMSIINFETVHPSEIKTNKKTAASSTMNAVQQFAISACMSIMAEANLMIPRTISKPYKNEPIAIVGMSFRLPAANTVDEFWDLLVNGKEAIQPVPPNRWTKEHTFMAHRDTKVEAGFLKVPVDEFDAKFFGISRKEALFLDPQQRFLHEVSWEALEDAGIDPLKLHGTQTGVFVGSWTHNYKELLMNTRDFEFFRTYMGNSIASEAARLSHFYGCVGPSIGTESGCSSAIAAVDLACKHLRNNRDSNLAIVGGVNLLLHPFTYDLMPMVLAGDGRCKTFDAKADGFTRAEGCGVFVMKRLSDAFKDGDNIWGLVRGSAITQEGISKSLGTPTVHCEALAMKLALKDADVEGKDVGFIETHGTGTAVGDPMEVAAIAKAYSKNRTEPLFIGSVKTNVGHTESVSGITGIIKVLLSMKNEIIPRHLNFEILNPEIKLDSIPAQIPLSTIPWIRKQLKPRVAGVSSFGISGTDGHAIIEEPPRDYIQDNYKFGMERPTHIMKISAKTQESLQLLLQKYQEMLSAKHENLNVDDKEEFRDVAYSANIGRSTFNHRAVIIAKDFGQATKILQEKSYKENEIQASTVPICFLFTGQGSQYHGMAKQLYSTSATFKFYFDECSRVLREKHAIKIEEILWADSSDENMISRTLYSQTSIFCIEYCLLKLWESWGVKPDYVMGHSLGEFAAAVAAGILDFEDALMLVAERSRLIDNLPRGKMLVIKANKKTVEETIKIYSHNNSKFWADYAALNSAEQTVLAGDSQMIEDFAKFCGQRNLKAIILASTHAFHSRHMDPMLEAYRKVALSVKVGKVDESTSKYISGMEGKLIDGKSVDANYWVRHTREKVSFVDACKVAQTEGCNLFLEVGPHPVLSALVMMNIEGAGLTCLPSIRRKEDEWTTILDSLARLYLSEWKGEIDWKGFDSCYNRTKVSLPFYQFNRQSIWPKFTLEQPKIHPLLGRILPTALGQTIYENDINLKTVSFPLDHVIGNTVVFPGAGFLEMCLAGGHAFVQGTSGELTKPRRPIAITGLKIACPLAMYENEYCLLQSVVSLDETDKNGELGYSVSVSRRSDATEQGEGRWVLHASGKFLPVAEASIEYPKIDIESIKSTWRQLNSKELYDKAHQVGLHFGPKFQSREFGWESEQGTLYQVKVPEDQDSYLIHPVIGDAMLQASMLGTDDNLKLKLQVPVRIGEFVYYSSSELPDRYIYAWTVENSKHCILLDGSVNLLAYMGSVDLVETTVKLVEGMIQQQSLAMPKLWEETWKNCPGPQQNALNLIPVEYPKVSESTHQIIAEVNEVTPEEKQIQDIGCHMSRMYFLQALYKLGWAPKPEENYQLDDIMTSLKISSRHRGYVRFFLKSLVKQGHLHEVADNAFKIDSELSMSKVDSEIKADPSTRKDNLLIKEIGKNLSEILIGKLDPLQTLFPEDPAKPSVGDFYDIVKAWSFDKSKTSLFKDTIVFYFQQAQQRQKLADGRNIPIRVLEVGSGTGSFTLDMLQLFEEYGIEVELYYTDISSAFFGPSTEAKFEKYLSHITFRKFDMEVDPFEQGFCPKYFDLIMAYQVIHVAKNLDKTLRYLHSLLKPGGMVKVVETVTQDPRSTYLFGLLDGYWGFEDFHLRPDHITMSLEKWKDLLYSTGYESVGTYPAYMGIHGSIQGFAAKETTLTLKDVRPPKHSWLLFADRWNTAFTDSLSTELSKVNRKTFIVEQPQISADFTEQRMKEFMRKTLQSANQDENKLEGIIYMWGLSTDTTGNRDQSQISLPFLSLKQELGELKLASPRVFVITQGATNVDGSSVTNPSAGTIFGMLKSMSNENYLSHIAHFDMSPAATMEEQVNEVFSNLWMEGPELRHLSFSSGSRFRPVLVSSKLTCNDLLTVPSGCDRFQLVLPESKAISDLEFTYLDHHRLEENEVEMAVKAVALNFRDVLTVLKPIAYFDDFNQVGLDLSGVVTNIGSKVTKWKVGDRVIGLNANRNLALPSHIKANERCLIPLPDNMTLSEGATLPAVFFTVYHCLVQKTEMKKGETILIHTASGGVGLCAIQFCQKIGVNIIATAGSTRKRNYLKNLGIQHVFNSRTTDFGQEILKVTNGRGVDVVLNSITGTGFKEASLAALAKNGRFIEMSKLSVWTVDEVKELRPDVLYSLVDITTLDENEMEELRSRLQEYLEAGLVRPIPYELFDALNIREALNYLRKAVHIGKIVCLMPNITIEASKLIAKTQLFNEDSTYLVTGGLGGIGFEVVKYILANGGKHMVIASRSAPNEDIVKRIELMNKSGKHVQAFSLDIGDYSHCKNLLDTLQEPELGFPKLRGIMHAAGVLADSTVENQTWDKFFHTFNPKVSGTWNLHDLTKDMLLEHFVLYSSTAGLFGAPGQSNHSASTKFQDCFSAYRKSIGLCSTSINWANWGEVGVATEIDFPGVRPISTSQGLLALEAVLKHQTPQICVLNVESFQMLSKVFQSLNTYVDDKRLFGDIQTNEIIFNTNELWKKVDDAPDREGKIDVFKEFIRSVVGHILKMDASEKIDDQADFQSLGVDSLMMLELKNGLQNILGDRITLTANQLQDCNNVEMLAIRFVDILEGNDEIEHIPTTDELNALIREDSQLPEEICPSEEVLKTSSLITDIETVLLTGVTGCFGPYLLQQLCERSQIKKVYCLIRKSRKSPEDRLAATLLENELTAKVNMSKVECIQGDITDNNFGLEQDVYDKLAQEVDCIVHSAVSIDHTAKYLKSPKKTCARTVNVGGTVHVLRFAVSSKLKHILHASALLALGYGDEESDIENWQDVSAFDNYNYNSGYPVSKHIAEQLIRQGVERGIPCKAIRLPFITGDSVSGRSDFTKSHLLLRWLAFMKLGCMMDMPFPIPLLAVDKAAEYCMELFLNPEVGSDVYNFFHPNVDIEQVLIDVARDEFGIHIKPISFSELNEKLKYEDDSSLLAPFKKLYADDEEKIINAVQPKVISARHKYFKENNDFFANSKVCKYIPDFNSRFESASDVMKRDLQFLKRIGIFDKFGIPTTIK